MTPDMMSNRDLADAYVTAYVSNDNHDAEAAEIGHRGVGNAEMHDALGELADESVVEAMDEDAFDAATEAAADRLATLMSPTHTVTRRMGDLGIDPGYYNEATDTLMAAWCEDNLPDGSYIVENRYDRCNCSCHLLDAEGEAVDCDFWLDFQRSVDWNDNDEITVEVAGDADEADVAVELVDAAIDHIYDAEVREDAQDGLLAEARAYCGLTEE